MIRRRPLRSNLVSVPSLLLLSCKFMVGTQTPVGLCDLSKFSSQSPSVLGKDIVEVDRWKDGGMDALYSSQIKKTAQVSCFSIEC